MKVLIKNLDGTVGILHPILNCGLTLDEIIAKDVPKGVSYEIVEDDVIPTDRVFRNAWKHDLSVDILKAQDITKERLRAERKPLLEALDVEVMRNIKNPTKLDKIEIEKQRLRDITKVVDTLTTVEELKAVTL